MPPWAGKGGGLQPSREIGKSKSHVVYAAKTWEISGHLVSRVGSCFTV